MKTNVYRLTKGVFGLLEETVADLPSEALWCLSVCLSVLVDGFAVVAVLIVIRSAAGWTGRGGGGLISLQSNSSIRKLIENHIDELEMLIVVADGDDINAESFLRMYC